MKPIGIVLSTLLAELILMILFVSSGLYNVSTMSPDPGFLRWIFSHTSDNSAKHHSEGIAIPSLTDSAMIVKGHHRYHELCQTCHGGPGVTPSPIERGLYPHPPDLMRSAKHMGANRLFWVAKNGIKSTGMPGFGWTHSDKQIWSIVAFLYKMKDMTPQEYAAMGNQTVTEKTTDLQISSRNEMRRR